MKKTTDDSRLGQGRSRRQLESSYKILGWSCLGLIASLLIAGILTYFNIG